MADARGSQDDAMKIRLGISACLLGDRVRYDGGHRLDRFLRDTLGAHVEFRPVCPEVECGMGVPREALRLVDDPGSPRLVTRRDEVDHTRTMLRWARGRIGALGAERLDGFIFKGRSPSCGTREVKVYDREGASRWRGAGLFARRFMARFPLLPVEDEGRLHDPGLRENFVERIFTLRRWREAVARGQRRRVLRAFHARERLLVLSHSPVHCREMERLVTAEEVRSTAETFDRYGRMLIEALRRKATPGRNAKVLRHAMGRLGRRLDADERRELREAIERYRHDRVPLIVPVTLLGHYVRKYDTECLREQTYLNRHPLELGLRNHA